MGDPEVLVVVMYLDIVGVVTSGANVSGHPFIWDHVTPIFDALGNKEKHMVKARIAQWATPEGSPPA